MEITQKQEYLFTVLRTRRTVRKFTSDPVPERHLLKILNAARFAPSAGNQQPWKFLVIRNKEKRTQLKEKTLSWYMEKYGTEDESGGVRKKAKTMLENAFSAPIFIVVLVDTTKRYPQYVAYDGALAVASLMIAARALGYGTGFYTTFFPEAKVKEFFGIPDRYALICVTPLGVPEEWPSPPPKRSLNEILLHSAWEDEEETL